MTTDIDGFYVGYFTAEQGFGLGLFVLRNGALVGIDAGGVQFDGNYQLDADKSGYTGQATVKAPANGTLIQGVATGPNGLTYSVDLKLPLNLGVTPYLEIATPLGPVNVKFEKIRDLDDGTA